MPDPSKFARAQITERQDLAPDLWTIRIRPEEPVDFRPGQYVTLGTDVSGEFVERPYSIVSAPHEPTMELFVERIPDGALTPTLHALGPGDEVVVRRRCKGLFLREAPVAGTCHLFVATVTGIAPFVSILRSLRRREQLGDWTPDGSMWLLQGASRAHEFGYLEEMRALAGEASWFHFVPTVSRPWLDPEWDGECGRVEDVLRKHADVAGVAPGRGAVFLCGHPGMIEGARAIMRRRGLEDGEIHEEQYWPEGQTPENKAQG